MRRSIALVVALPLLALAGGCGKKESGDDPPPGPAGPAGAPKPKGMLGGIPLDQFPYDPTRPELKIDLAAVSSFVPAKDPTAAEWAAKGGKVAEVRGVMGRLSEDLKSRRETYLVKSEVGKNAIACESLFPPDWRKVSPGRSVTVVGVLDVTQGKDGGANLRLKDAHVTAVSDEKNQEVSAEQLGKEFSAGASEFHKKWRVRDRYYYVTGVLKKVDKIPRAGGGVAYKFRLAGGPTDLYCQLQNERGVDEGQPKVGDTVTLLLECEGYDGGSRMVWMGGVYVDKGQ
jgi:hypothetical protein